MAEKKTSKYDILGKMVKEQNSFFTKEARRMGLENKRYNKAMTPVTDDKTNLKQRLTPMPKDYPIEEPGVGNRKSPSDYTLFSKLPSGGEYTLDVEKPGALIQSQRMDTQSDKAKLLKGKPSFGYQVDHIVPISLGGTDTDDNKEVLSIYDHAKKTKVGAVARALYYSKAISLREATVMLVDWRNRRVDDFELGDKGEVSTEVALKKQEDWKKPEKVTFGDLYDGFKDSVSKAVSKADEVTEGIVNKLPDNYFGDTVKGFVEGLSMGYTEGEETKYKEDDKNLKSSLFRGAGNLVGSIASFVAMEAAIVAGFAASPLTGGTSGAAAVTAQTATLARGAKLLAKARGAVPSIVNKFRSLSKAPAIAGGKITTQRNLTHRFMREAGLFSIFGQLSKQEESGLEARVDKLKQDIVWGGFEALAPLRGKSNDAIAKLLKKEAKHTAGIFAGAYTVSSLLGNDAGQAAMDAAFMTGLHGVERYSSINQLENGINNVSYKFRQKWGGIAGDPSIKKVKSPKALKALGKEIDRENDIIKERIWRESATKEQAEEEIRNLVMTGRQLYKGGMSTQGKLLADKLDFESLKARLRTSTKSDFNKTTPGIQNVMDKFSNVKNKKVKVSDAEKNSPLVNREAMATGVSSKIDKQTAKNVIDYRELGGGENGDKLVLVSRPDMVDFMKKKFIQKSGDPLNNLQLQGAIDGKIFPLGFASAKKRTDEINKTIMEKGQTGIDTTFHKDEIAKLMKEEGLDNIIVTAVVSGEGKISKEPYIRYVIKPEDIAMSKKLSKEVTGKDVEKGVAKKEMEIKETPYESLKKKNGEKPAHTLMNEEFTIEDRTVVEQVRIIENAIKKSDNDISNTLNDLFERGLKDDVLEKMIKDMDDGTFTIGKYMNMLKSADENNALSSLGMNAYNSMLEFAKTLSYDDKIAFKSIPFNGSAKTGGKAIDMKKVLEKTTSIKKKPTAKNEKLVKIVKEKKKQVELPFKKKVTKEAKKVVETVKKKTSPVAAKTKKIKEVIKNKPTVTSNVTELLNNSKVKSSFHERNLKRLKEVNRLIGRGSKGSETGAYIDAASEISNLSSYTKKDKVGIITEGNTKGAIDPDYKEIDKAIKAGSDFFVVSDKNSRKRSFNKNDDKVAEYLKKNDYVEVYDGEFRHYSKLSEVEKRRFIDKEGYFPGEDKSKLPSNIVKRELTEEEIKEFSDRNLKNTGDPVTDLFKLISAEVEDALLDVDGTDIKKYQNQLLSIINNIYIDEKYLKKVNITKVNLDKVRNSIKDLFTPYAEDLVFTKFGRAMSENISAKVKKKVSKGVLSRDIKEALSRAKKNEKSSNKPTITRTNLEEFNKKFESKNSSRGAKSLSVKDQQEVIGRKFGTSKNLLAKDRATSAHKTLRKAIDRINIIRNSKFKIPDEYDNVSNFITSSKSKEYQDKIRSTIHDAFMDEEFLRNTKIKAIDLAEIKNWINKLSGPYVENLMLYRLGGDMHGKGLIGTKTVSKIKSEIIKSISKKDVQRLIDNKFGNNKNSNNKNNEGISFSKKYFKELKKYQSSIINTGKYKSTDVIGVLSDNIGTEVLKAISSKSIFSLGNKAKHKRVIKHLEDNGYKEAFYGIWAPKETKDVFVRSALLKHKTTYKQKSEIEKIDFKIEKLESNKVITDEIKNSINKLEEKKAKIFEEMKNGTGKVKDTTESDIVALGKKTARDIKKNAESKTPSAGRAYNSILDKSFEEMFGKNYENNEALGKTFNDFIKENTITLNKQSKEALIERGDKNIKDLTPKEKDAVFLKEENKKLQQNIAREDQTGDVDLSKYGIGVKSIVSGDLKIRNEGDYLHDVTLLDEMFSRLLRREIDGKPYTVKDVTEDTERLLKAFIHYYNRNNYDTKGLRLDPQFIKKIKSEAIENNSVKSKEIPTEKAVDLTENEKVQNASSDIFDLITEKKIKTEDLKSAIEEQSKDNVKLEVDIDELSADLKSLKEGKVYSKKTNKKIITNIASILSSPENIAKYGIGSTMMLLLFALIEKKEE